MTTVTYLNGATSETYSSQAIGYISTPQVSTEINATATLLGVSAGAIAGAMVEENNAYDSSDEALDKYARSGLDVG